MPAAGKNASLNKIDTEIGSRVRSQRLILGLSQTQLGEKIGVTFQQVQKYEKGTNRISGSRMTQIATVLEVEPAFFFGVAKQRTKASGANGTDEVLRMLERGDTVRLVRAFSLFKGKARAAIVDMVEALSPAND